MDLDDLGYFKGMPIAQEQWESAIEGEPDGTVMVRQTLPPGVLLYQNYLDPDVCDEIVREADAQTGIRHTVGKTDNGDMDITADSARKSELVGASSINVDIVSLVREIYGRLIQAHFNTEIEWFEAPEILRYREGGEYIPHSDSENWNGQARKWERKVDRDYSILVYLNEGYFGGDLVFPNFGVRIAPKRGMLIAFPSDARYLHAAKPVLQGVRYALVSWAAAKNTPRVNKTAPANSVRMG